MMKLGRILTQLNILKISKFENDEPIIARHFYVVVAQLNRA